MDKVCKHAEPLQHAVSGRREGDEQILQGDWSRTCSGKRLLISVEDTAALELDKD